ncbi:unnamed protein product [Choristocarpus tenellus]
MYGEVGAASYPVDVLSWDSVSGRASLRVLESTIVPVHAALTLVGSYEGLPCAMTVLGISPFLAGLACERFL